MNIQEHYGEQSRKKNGHVDPAGPKHEPRDRERNNKRPVRQESDGVPGNQLPPARQSQHRNRNILLAWLRVRGKPGCEQEQQRREEKRSEAGRKTAKRTAHLRRGNSVQQENERRCKTRNRVAAGQYRERQPAGGSKSLL